MEVEDGWLNRWDDEMDDGSSSRVVDEGRRAVAVDDVVGGRGFGWAAVRWRMEEGGVSRLEQRGYKRRRWEGEP